MNSDDKLQSIMDKLNILEIKIDALNDRIRKCESSCQNMDEHIHFVEETYDTLKYPLDYVKNKVNGLIGYESKPMPKMDKLLTNPTGKTLKLD